MPVHDEIGKRMKSNYEEISKTRLVRRMPVIIRLDGKAFHTFTRGFKRPFDHVLMRSMQDTMQALCEGIQGCVLGYHQSDEISLLLIDYKKHNSEAWFDYEVQKMCSISASIATLAFHKSFDMNIHIHEGFLDRTGFLLLDEEKEYINTLKAALAKGALFDSRVFNIPKEEVTNYFYWRQLDATRNSIQMVGQANFSHSQLHKKTCNQIQEMLHEERGINWNDFSVPEKRGTLCYKEDYFIPESELPEEHRINLVLETMDPEEDSYGVWRSRWKVDLDIPIFVNKGRDIIERLVEG